MEIDRNGLEVLDRDECIRCLAAMPVARLGLSMQALPVILPVNFVVTGEEIIVRTNMGAKAEAALAGAVVAVEVDEYDPFDHTGWSVLVRGRARLIEDPDEVERCHALWVRAWGTAHTDRWMAIAMEIVTGRRIRRDIAGEHPVAPDRTDPVDVADAVVGADPVGRSEADEPDLRYRLEWASWGAVRADHHTTAADPRTTVSDRRITWSTAAPDPSAADHRR